MLVFSLFAWWYGPGWKNVVSSFSKRLSGVAEIFSANQLLKTIFAPWRRIITYPGASLAERWRAWIDNLFSRLVGFGVRIFVLLAALVVLIITSVVTMIEILVWPLLPIGFLICLILGIGLWNR
jgi:hypothetical protein